MVGRSNAVGGGSSAETYKIVSQQTVFEFSQTEAKPGQFVESSETNERTGNIEISTDSGKAVPYELSGNWVVKCVFVMPDENVTIPEKGV